MVFSFNGLVLFYQWNFAKQMHAKVNNSNNLVNECWCEDWLSRGIHFDKVWASKRWWPYNTRSSVRMWCGGSCFACVDHFCVRDHLQKCNG
jgi:hypothetical protein